MDRQRRVYTYSRESGMESSPLIYICLFFVVVFLVTWDDNLPISNEKKITLTIKMASMDPPYNDTIW